MSIYIEFFCLEKLFFRFYLISILTIKDELLIRWILTKCYLKPLNIYWIVIGRSQRRKFCLVRLDLSYFWTVCFRSSWVALVNHAMFWLEKVTENELHVGFYYKVGQALLNSGASLMYCKDRQCFCVICKAD